MITNRKQAGRYFRKVAKAMGLAHWEIYVTDKPPSRETSIAEVLAVQGQAAAYVSLSDSFFEATEAYQRYVAVHELIHVHFACPDRIASSSMVPGAHAAWEWSVEYSVDALSNVLAPFMPMP